MKGNYQWLLGCLFCTMFTFSQNLQNAQITYSNLTGIPEFVRFPKENALDVQGATLQQKALNFLREHSELYGIQSVESEFRFNSEKTDTYGFTTLEFLQIFHEVPVYDGKLKFHFNSENKLTAVNGNVIGGIKLNPQATLSATQANSIALAEVGKQNLNMSGVPVFVNSTILYVFQKGLAQNMDEGQYLVYEVEVRNDADVREFMYIDAHDGKMVEQFTGIAHALSRIVYENTTSTVAWQEGNAFPGGLSIWQQNEVVVSGHMYNFFRDVFNYTSYNNADAMMRTVNNSFSISCPNASWNGSTANFCDGTASDDVIAHEWGHAYTQYTSGLIYAYQAGAINESYSDIWGETIDLINNYQDAGENLSLRTGCNSSQRWRIGEDATGFGSPIRDMWNPNCNGDPGRVTDGIYYCGSGDSGGVHINSGIPNHAYALLVDGGNYNGQTINGLGMTKAAHIFWRAQSTYLTSTSDFAALADALESACTDLIGINLEGLSTTGIPAGPSGQIISSSDFNELVKVILAVELRLDPSQCNFEPILAATNDPCEAATSNPIFYEDWESGMGSWVATQIPGHPHVWEPRNWTIESNMPNRSGQGIFGPDPINGNCTTSLQDGILRLESPLINIPNYTTGIFEMVFNHNIATEPLWDGGNIKYSLNGGPWTIIPGVAFTANPYNDAINDFANDGNDNPMQGQPAFTGTDEGTFEGSWGRSYVNLSSLGVTANSNIKFRWELGTDGCNGRVGWYLDEISVYNCNEPLSTADFASLENVFQIYPNPSSGSFSIKNKHNFELRKAEVYDINGRLIQTFNLSSAYQQDLTLEKVRSGMYFVTIYSEAGKKSVKLLIE